MKKLILLLVLFLLCACGNQNQEIVEEVKEKINVYSLKGPTSMGLVKLMDEHSDLYEFHVVTSADEVSAAIAKNEADIALLPANLASVLYSKNPSFKVTNINTLGVLYLVEKGNSINSLNDLVGKTIYLTGKGTTSEYALDYLLKERGIKDKVTLEFKTESTEIISALASDLTSVALLPEPFVSSALMTNKDLRVAISLKDEFEKIASSNILVTGVTIASNNLIENRKEDLDLFLDQYKESIDYVNDENNIDEVSNLIVNLGIVNKAEIAKKALPNCNITFIDGINLKGYLTNYLTVLYKENPQSIGGSIPNDDFYYE